jgi:DNA-binding NarL/FixJ family response regulator
MYNLIIINKNKEQAETLKVMLSQQYFVKGIFSSLKKYVEALPQKSQHYITIYCNDSLENIAPFVNSRFIVFNDLENDKLLFNAIQMGVTNFVHQTQKTSELLYIIALVTMGGSYISSNIMYMFYKYNRDVNIMVFGNNRKKYKLLSKRELMVFEQLLSGVSYKGISNNLMISLDTTRKHISAIYKKLEIHSKGELYNLHYNVVSESNQSNSFLLK